MPDTFDRYALCTSHKISLVTVLLTHLYSLSVIAWVYLKGKRVEAFPGSLEKNRPTI